MNQSMSYMKRILSLFALLLVSVIGFAQAPSNYTNINGRYRWIAGMFDSTFSLPKGTTPSLRTGGSTNGGALFYRTSDSTVKYWTGTQWLTLSDSTRYVPYVGAIKDVDLDTWSLNAKSLHVKGTAGNGHLGLKFQSATPNMSANETGLYADASGNFGVKIDNAHTSIFKTSLNTADRTYTFQNKSYTVADSADVAAKIGGTLISGYLTKATGTNTIDTSRIFQYDGRIGIGITTPSKLLHVNGDAIINTLTIGFGKGSVSSNTAVGYQSLNSNTTGQNNTAVGYGTMQANTSGTQNTAIGNISLYSNTTGTNNTAIGNSALSSNLSGNSNVSIGHNSLSSNTTGFQNVAVGIQSLNANTTGESNTAIGTGALANIITGTYNAALGISSGRYITAGGYNATSTESVYFGYDTRASADGNTNEVVIGSQAIGNGSNSVTLGNSSITKTILRSNVGIGTASPDSALTVVNGAYFQRGVRMSGLPTGVGTKALRIDATGKISTSDTLANGISGTGTTNYIPKFTSSSAIGNSLLYDDGISVGLGTTSPVSAGVGMPTLDIAGASTKAATLWLHGNGTTTNTTGFQIQHGTNSLAYLWNFSNTAMVFATNNTERMRLDASGNLGLGTSSPNANFQINSGSTSTLKITNTNTGTAAGDGLDFIVGTDLTAYIWNRENSPLLFGTNATERMRLDASGRLGIGTTSPAYKLDVNGTVGVNGNTISNGQVNILKNSTYNSEGSAAIAINSTNTAANTELLIGADDTNGIGYIQTAAQGSSFSTKKLSLNPNGGNVGIGTTSPNASALLDITSTTKGFLPPRMTGAQAEAITTPAAGLMIYSNSGNGTTITSTGWWGYDGTAWVKIK